MPTFKVKCHGMGEISQKIFQKFDLNSTSAILLSGYRCICWEVECQMAKQNSSKTLRPPVIKISNHFYRFTVTHISTDINFFIFIKGVFKFCADKQTHRLTDKRTHRRTENNTRFAQYS